MYVLRMGIISSLLSETLVSGFTTGAAIHVFTSQVKDLLGLKLTPIVGNFKIIFVSYQTGSLLKVYTFGFQQTFNLFSSLFVLSKSCHRIIVKCFPNFPKQMEWL